MSIFGRWFRANGRKEQSILAALVFGCSCGSNAPPPYRIGSGDWAEVAAAWLRTHTRCAGLGAMVREDA